ncbi:MAG: beta-propeller domain-containing protein [Clostridia bacterium]
MKKIFAILVSLILVLSGCSGNAKEDAAVIDDIKVNNERLVKEFMGTVNIFHRAGDNLMLSAEEGDQFKFYDLDVSSTQVKESELTEMAGSYIYYEPIGNRGFIVVEELDYKNTLKFMGRDNVGKVIAEDIGSADAINISISPKASKVIYTSLIEGSDVYGIYIYDMDTASKNKLMDIKSDGLIEGFSYLINWSPDENNVIIHDKYIYDTHSGSQRGELKSAYSQWSPTGSKIAFLLEDGSEQWLPTTDYFVYPGKKVCVYDISKGSYDEVFKIEGDEFIFGGITWGGKDSKLAFSGIRVKDMSLPDWYMKLNYSSVYIVELESKKNKRLETNVDASDGTMIELGNLKFSNQGNLLSFTVGNYEKSSLHIVNTTTLEAKTFANTEYLHWIDGENFLISAGKDTIYFCRDNSIIRIDENLQENIKYTSKTKLDDFYMSKDEKGMLVFELQDNVHTVRYIGE